MNHIAFVTEVVMAFAQCFASTGHHPLDAIQNVQVNRADNGLYGDNVASLDVRHGNYKQVADKVKRLKGLLELCQMNPCLYLFSRE